MTTDMSILPRATASHVRDIDIELLALDLNTCTRCVGTLANIEQAVDTLQQILPVTGAEVRVHTMLVTSEEQARQYRFVTSPTIRINGRDITLETLDSHCDSCSDLGGCEEGTNCRVWRYQGQEYTEAPVGMIVDAVLNEIYGGGQPHGFTPVSFRDVPENLHRFFNSRGEHAVPIAATCCPPSEQATCCAPSEKASCCGPSDGAGCGCQ